MLLGIIAAVSTVAALTAIFTIFSVITDNKAKDLPSGNEEKDRDGWSPMAPIPTQARTNKANVTIASISTKKSRNEERTTSHGR